MRSPVLYSTPFKLAPTYVNAVRDDNTAGSVPKELDERSRLCKLVRTDSCAGRSLSLLSVKSRNLTARASTQPYTHVNKQADR